MRNHQYYNSGAFVHIKNMLRHVSQLTALLLCLFLIHGCGFHIQNNLDVPPQFQYLQFYSNDRYGLFSREIYQLLKSNDVVIVNEEGTEKGKKIASYPALYIDSTDLQTYVTSIYADAKSAESQMTLEAKAHLVVNGKNYPLRAKIFRTFFDNPATPLAKSTEQDLIEDDMYKQAALQLIQNLRTVNIKQQKHK